MVSNMASAMRSPAPGSILLEMFDSIDSSTLGEAGSSSIPEPWKDATSGDISVIPTEAAFLFIDSSKNLWEIGRVMPFHVRHRHQGFALVLTLALLVLVAGLVTAYFSHALQERRSGSLNRAEIEGTLIAAAAQTLVLDDFHNEISAGSETSDDSTASRFSPILVPHPEEGFPPLAPSMSPWRNPNDQFYPNVVKVSRAGLPFHEADDGYGPTAGPSRASSVNSTSDPSLNDRFLSRESWNEPRLMTPAEFDGNDESPPFPAPDWIYLDRKGTTPLPEPEAIHAMADPSPDNPDFVLARFAYVIYDVGGLIDINVAGNALPDTENRHRGRLHQIDLVEGPGRLQLPGFTKFVEAWRWPDRAEDQTFLFDPTASFLEVEAGAQGLVTRQDLIEFARQSGSELSEEALPFLTIFSRSVNAPHWRPDPGRSKEPPQPDPDELNPDLPGIRFTEETVLDRGSDPAVTVSAGSPVMPRRFPLGKLDLFNSPNPDEESLLYYFGLERVPERVATFTYAVATPDGRIARLHEVAAQGREPNFFEVLQAVILTGSLGKSAGHSYTLDMLRDELRNLQILQIGANIMDQWDSDDIPTTLLFPSGDSADPWLEVYGTENLPYLHQFALVPHRPGHDPDRFQLWAIFDLWNPHQNAQNPPSGIENLRVKPVAGQFHNLRIFYDLLDYDPRWRGDRHWWYYGYHRGAELDIAELGEPMEFSSFPGPDGFSEPATARGNAPATEEDFPGLLLWDHDLGDLPAGGTRANPAIPSIGFRPPDFQVLLNNLVDFQESDGTKVGLSPYTADRPYIEDPMGNREYPPETQFTGLDETFWEVRQSDDGRHLLRARFAVKAHNAKLETAPSAQANFDIYDAAWHPESLPLSFALQAEINGEWVTYQRVDDFFRRSASNRHRRGVRSYDENDPEFVDYVLREDTHHSVLNDEEIEGLESSFYEWRPIEYYQRFDPRGQRFGFSEALGTPLGTPLRSSLEPWNGRRNRPHLWIAWRYGIPARQPPGSELGFEYYGSDAVAYAPAGIATNHPETLSSLHTLRYPDRDGVIRPADAYFGDGEAVVPMSPGRFGDRPVLLNRPFRSVGDLGYVFRDQPWKTLDFSTRYSADLGLLDVFSLDESTEAVPLVAGKVNLNTRRPEVLSALLRGAAENFPGPDSALPTTEIDGDRADLIAAAIMDETGWQPVVYPGDLVSRVFHPPTGDDVLGDVVKGEREAALRTLTALGDTRTWNFMMDLVVQTGRFTSASTDGADFLVQSEHRYWIHVAMDRLTGEIVDLQTETVHP